jgi:predicted nucleic acid-binding protein
LIDISRAKQQALEFVDSLPTALELIVGARDKRDLESLDASLSGYVIVPIHESIGSKAYELLKTYAKSHGLHVFDSLVAATAIEEGLTLVTRNRRHFRMIDPLSLQVPEY